MTTVAEVVERAVRHKLLPPGTPADAAYVDRIITSVVADIFFTMGARPFVEDIYVSEPVRLLPAGDMTWEMILSDADEKVAAMSNRPEREFLRKLLALRVDLASAVDDGTGSGQIGGD